MTPANGTACNTLAAAGLAVGLWLAACLGALAQQPSQTVTPTDTLSLDTLPAKATLPAQVVVRDIRFIGMKWNRPQAMKRELDFAVGDTLAGPTVAQTLERGRQQLYNTRLFNRVAGTYLLVPDNGLVVEYRLEERWYLWPDAVLDLADYSITEWLVNPNWGRITYGMALSHHSLTGARDPVSVGWSLGYQQGLNLNYRRPLTYRGTQLDLGARFRWTRFDQTDVGSRNGLPQRMITDEGHLREDTEGQLAVIWRRTPRRELEVNLGLRHTSVQPLVQDQLPQYLPNGSLSTTYLPLGIRYDIDERDRRHFPLAGWRAQASLELNLPLGPHPAWARVAGRLLGFQELGTPRLTAAAGLFAQAVYGQVPYPHKVLPGRQLAVRAYEPYFLTATFMAVTKLELRYALVRHQLFRLKGAPEPFRIAPIGLYPYAYLDVGYLADGSQTADDGTFLDRPLVGGGLGLMLPLPYDNVVRAEGGLNHLGLASIQLNFTLAIQ